MGNVFADHSMSLDGFSTGPNVRLDNGMGDGGEALHEWMFHDGGKTGHSGEDNPPFHRPVFVVTHRSKAMVTKQGGTTYTFVTDGLEATVAQARATAGDRDVVVLGGATIIRECLRAGLLSELRLHLAHILLGGGTSLFNGVDPANPRARADAVDRRRGCLPPHLPRRQATMRRADPEAVGRRTSNGG